ncbi:MAG: shikimate dehydrogenase [Actinobacteria bacterium]|nr:shikimate dehydrogenase [Actinomycetota bacterium]
MTNNQFNSSTRLAAIIGNPVAQSLSPAIHNAVFRALKIDWVYLAFLVESGKVRGALDAMSVLGIAGYSVTMPHKNEVAKIVSEIGEVDEVVRLTNAANTVMLQGDGRICATNTDGQGACNAIEAMTSQKIAKCRAFVVGAGGTAAAVVYSLIKNGATEVVISNRTPRNAEQIAQNYDNCRVSRDIEADIASVNLIINTTPVGFSPEAATRGSEAQSPIDVALIGSTQTVLDAVYRPLETNLLRAAKNAGAQTVDGLEMLVHQAALQQQFWLGQSGDTSLMRSAALNNR